MPTRPALPPVDTTALVTRLCRLIEASEQAPSLTALAAHTPWQPGHLQRVFKAVTGLSPRAYAQALRAQRVREALASGQSVTTAFHAAGFGSSGRFYEAADRLLGMTPGQYRARAARLPIRFAVGQCSLGAILVAQSERGLCAILLGDAPEVLLQDLQDRFPQAELIGGDGDFEQVVATVVGFVEQPAVGLTLPLDIRGTAFQQRVWQALQAIPPGQTCSYTDVAERLGAPQAVRAVAGACAANALAVAIPCHRVVRQDGGLSGYRWGIERKRALLDRESRLCADPHA